MAGAASGAAVLRRPETMERVTGIGGIFFKANDPDKLATWYREHLGIAPSADGSVVFRWREDKTPETRGYTVWAPFPAATRYFDPSTAPFMINYRVRDLDLVLAELAKEGVTVERREDSEFGRFAWLQDPEGNRIELWQPAGEPPPEAADFPPQKPAVGEIDDDPGKGNSREP